MEDLIVGVVIIGVLFYIISLIMEYRAKNFLYEKHGILLSLIMMTSMYLYSFIYSFKQNQSYSMLINVIITVVILGGYIIFQKNRIYFFKGIDKKFVKENRNEIIEIIKNYKSIYTDYDADITLANKKVVFERVSKAKSEECLSLIGNYLDEKRKKYTFKDYLVYHIKGQLLPAVITILVVFLLFKNLP